VAPDDVCCDEEGDDSADVRNNIEENLLAMLGAVETPPTPPFRRLPTGKLDKGPLGARKKVFSCSATMAATSANESNAFPLASGLL
jgi:hypothetical protein